MNANIALQLNKAVEGAPRSPRSLPHRILVVEDDPSIREINTEALIQCGYRVDSAEDGAAAWDTLQVQTYDLVVTDNEMPKVTGMDLLKNLRAASMPLPVIMATGTLPEAELARHPEIHPAAILIKPYSIDELVATVKKVLHPGDCAGGQTAPPPAAQNQRSTDDWYLKLQSLRRNDAANGAGNSAQ